MFVLCRTCAETRRQTRCDHDAMERALYGCWCTPELTAAVARGYRVLERYEAWDFERSSQHCKETGEEGLFADYVNTFLKIKQESAGFPSSAVTEEEKTRYIEAYAEHEGVELDPGQIAKNPGRYYVAKIVLNLLWGKLSQRNGTTQVEFVDKARDYIALMTCKGKEVHDLDFVSDAFIAVKWKHKADSERILPHACMVLAAFTTAYARLKLYSVMETLDRRLLYVDTDSVIFTSSSEHPPPPLGPFLGELTTEVSESEGGSIREYVSAGPKSYAYETMSGAQVCKVRGFTLTHASSQLLNFESVKEIVVNERRGEVVTQSSTIGRDAHSRLFTRPQRKVFKACFDKRIVTGDQTTFPFGWDGPEIPA